METYEHYHHTVSHNESWLKRHRWGTYLALGILAYFLLVEHREHVFPFLPYLIILACPLMHIFMNSGHRHERHPRRDQEVGQ